MRPRNYPLYPQKNFQRPQLALLNSRHHPIVLRHHTDYLPSVFARNVPAANHGMQIAARFINVEYHIRLARIIAALILNSSRANHRNRRMRHVVSIKRKQSQVVLVYLVKNVPARRHQVIAHPHCMANVDRVIDALVA